LTFRSLLAGGDMFSLELLAPRVVGFPGETRRSAKFRSKSARPNCFRPMAAFRTLWGYGDGVNFNSRMVCGSLLQDVYKSSSSIVVSR
jgi:hypothetical protein